MLFERSKNSPVASRILALLIVSDRAELTFDEIRSALNISKSATSNALTLLMHTRSVMYITKPNDRKRYFRSCFIHWHEQVRETFRSLEEVIKVLRKILAQRPPHTVEFNRGLEDVILFVEFVAGEMPSLFKKWESVKNQTNRSI